MKPSALLPRGTPATRWARVKRSARASLRALLVVALAVALALDVAFDAAHDALIDEALFARPLDPVLVTDRDGIALRRSFPDAVDREWVSLDEAGPNVRQAFLAAEDARFYEHGAVDPQAILRAVAVDAVPGGRVSGASTITQQVVKLVYGRPHGLWEKPLEIARAVELERRFTKDEILEQYLNRVPMGNGIVGVARASEAYFGRAPSELSLAEAALLAGVPQAPSITEPRRHLARARARQAYVLDRIEALGWRSSDELAAAREEPLALAVTPPRPFRAPRFVDRALAERRERGLPSRTLGTTLSWPLTEDVGELLREGTRMLGDRGASNAAGLVVLNRTGEIVAYVGAADETGEGGALDLLASRRQPGSTLKPFAYALFFEQGGTPSTPVDDLRRPMTGRSGSLYLPGDFDGRERGPVPARLALASSLNLAALDVVTRVGPDHFVDRLAELGLSRARSADRESAAMVLGGIDVTGLELAEAYVALARGGTRVPLRVLPAAPSEGERVIAEPAARLVTDVLSDAEARRAGFGRDLADLAGDDAPFALKTGTSQGFRDAWAAVYDDDLTVLVWIGDPSGEAMDGVSGFEGAAPLAVRTLGLARARRAELVGAPDGAAPERARLATVSVCAQTGLLPGPHCHHVVREHFDPSALPHETCHGHADDGTLALAPRYAEWARRASPAGVTVRAATPSAHHAPVRMSYPRDGATLLVPHAATITLRASEEGARFEVDGHPLAADRWALAPGHHTVVAVLDRERSEASEIDVVTLEAVARR